MSSPTPAILANAVTVLATRRARAGHESAFVSANEGMTAAARSFPGHLGGYTVHPVDLEGLDARLYHVVFAFDTRPHLQHWQQSAERARWIAEMAPHTETESGYRLIPGLEDWFAPSGKPSPPRWKVAAFTWLGICPTVWLAQAFVGPLIAHWPSLSRVALLTALVAMAMTWAVAPLLTKLFARWLYPAAPSARA